MDNSLERITYRALYFLNTSVFEILRPYYREQENFGGFPRDFCPDDYPIPGPSLVPGETLNKIYIEFYCSALLPIHTIGSEYGIWRKGFPQPNDPLWPILILPLFEPDRFDYAFLSNSDKFTRLVVEHVCAFDAQKVAEDRLKSYCDDLAKTIFLTILKTTPVKWILPFGDSLLTPHDILNYYKSTIYNQHINYYNSVRKLFQTAKEEGRI